MAAYPPPPTSILLNWKIKIKNHKLHYEDTIHKASLWFFYISEPQAFISNRGNNDKNINNTTECYMIITFLPNSLTIWKIVNIMESWITEMKLCTSIFQGYTVRCIVKIA